MTGDLMAETRVSGSRDLFSDGRLVGSRLFGMDGVDVLFNRKGDEVGYVEKGRVYDRAGNVLQGVSAPEYVAKC